MTLSVVIIAKNEEEWLANCLRSVAGLAAEIVVVDCGSTDKTIAVAEKFNAKVFIRQWEGFAAQKNFALTKTRGDWVLFVDADERVSQELKIEIQRALDKAGESAYALPRQNILLGQRMKYGGWEPDYVTRLAPKNLIIGWEGDLHEELKVACPVEKMNGVLYHLSHRGITWMQEKSIKYTPIEAKLRFEAGHPPVTWWRFLRVMGSEFFYRLIIKSGWRDGIVGWIEAISQSYNMFLIYVQLWEKQQGETMTEKYQEIDRGLAKNGF